MVDEEKGGLLLLHWVAIVCFLEWGLIHILAGVQTFYFASKPDIPSLLIGICQGVTSNIKEEAQQIPVWSPMNVRILAQHGLNLLWVGVWSTGMAIVIANSATIPRSMFVMGLWPYFADVAYFYAVDLVNYGTIVSEMQTVIVSVGLGCSGRLVLHAYDDVGPFEKLTMEVLPAVLLVAAIVNKAIEIGKSSSSGYEEL